MALLLRCGMLFGLLVLGACSATFAADLLPDNNPDHVRPIPPLGIEVPEGDRKELEAGLEKLGAMLDGLKGDKNYADVAIFHRAVRVALVDQEFFDPKEIDTAKKLLAVGRERAEQLQRGETPWLKALGLVVRGYISTIDHTPQPYGLVIPDSYDFEGSKRRHRIDLWLHGRGETLTELNFIIQRMNSVGPISPTDTVVLHPYGRYCNAYKFAGETDAFEALQATAQSYWSDYRQIAVRGFSMGGAACWHFAAHHPSRWFAANPGAGFAETPVYLQFNKKETLAPTWWEEKLWRWYDCPGYVANLRNLPVVAYSGEDDLQKQAADIMAAAYEKEGMKLTHIVGPKTGHSIHPESATEIDAKLDEWLNPENRHLPLQKSFVTYTLIYRECDWVSINGLDEHWEEARIDLEQVNDNLFRVKTKNIQRLSLHLDRLVNPMPARKIDVDLDGQRLRLDSHTRRSLARSNGEWKEYVSKSEKVLRKAFSSCGPIDHAFMSSFIFVKPSGQCANPVVQQWVDAEMNRAITQWRRQFRGDVRIKLDTEVTDEDIWGSKQGNFTNPLLASNLILWGDRRSNSLIEKIADQLPIKWTESEIAVAEQKFDASHHALMAIHPNPLNPHRYIVLNSGFTFREYDYLTNARQTPKLPDWAVVDLRTPPNSRWPGKIVAADFFDEEWKLKPQKK